MNKPFVITTVLMAAALTGILSTNPIAFAQDESETNTEQEIKQKNVGSGESTNNNCALNSIDSLAATVACFGPVGPTSTLEELPSTTEIE
jgi:thiamine monophosphate synthase